MLLHSDCHKCDLSEVKIAADEFSKFSSEDETQRRVMAPGRVVIQYTSYQIMKRLLGRCRELGFPLEDGESEKLIDQYEAKRLVKWKAAQGWVH